jgi:hypothetical protein
MKRIMIISILLAVFSIGELCAIDGFFLGAKTGLMLKIDIAGGLKSKRKIDPEMKTENSIPTGIGQYGDADSHGFTRVIESPVAPYGDMIFNWGYKFPKVFTLGFGILLSNIIMPSLMFDFKFTISEKHIVKPYVFLSIYSGLLDGFPIGLTTGAGIDIYLTKNFYFLVESKLGAELFVSRYYDDGNNTHPIWHWDSFYAYGIWGIYIGVGYQFKNPYTDENGKWIGKVKKE